MRWQRGRSLARQAWTAEHWNPVLEIVQISLLSNEGSNLKFYMILFFELF